MIFVVLVYISVAHDKEGRKSERQSANRLSRGRGLFHSL